ncbi:uncharacterized protein LOC117323814 [Pecten maximus]|uniref:uncharacterized protein LOC117323814 n=1 Tax=Pecten maximus TaxID=6579 RepID=UPI001458B48D|nr:uncharacterized protein LOC117323814 [Pecten maximus]
MPTLVMPFNGGSADPDSSDTDSKNIDSRLGLKDSLTPILWIMKVTGLLRGVTLKRPCQKQSSDVSAGRCCSPSLVYGVFVVCLLWCNVALSLWSFRDMTSFDGVVCNQIITSTWFFQVASTALGNIWLSKRWNRIFTAWDKHVKSLDPRLAMSDRRCAVVGAVLYVVWLLAEFGFVGIGAYLLGGGGIGSGGSFTDHHHFNVFFQFLFVLIFFYFISAWYLMTAVFSILAIGLYRAFKAFSKRFEENFVDGIFKGDVEQLRQKHGSLVRLLGMVDGMVSVYIMLIVGTIIPLIIFTLYFVLFESIDTFSYMATWWSVSLSVIQIMLVFIGGGLVNYMAHYPVEALYDIDLGCRTSEECHQITIFLNQLTSHPIGFTAFGLFTIDRPTIITFAGSIVTYAVVVIQFAPSDGAVDQFVCNCSCM